MASSPLDFEEKLILQIQERPYLYDIKSADYKDKMKKRNGWEKISEELKKDVKSCMEEWESLRKQYTSYLRKIDYPTGSAYKSTPFFRHSQTMEFYRKCYRPHKNKTTSNYGLAATTNDEDEDEDMATFHSCNNEMDTSVVHNFDDVESVLDVQRAKTMAEASCTVEIPQKQNITKRKSADPFEEKFLHLYANKIKEDEYYHFGQIVATKLRDAAKTVDVLDIQINILELIKNSSQISSTINETPQ